MKKTKCTFVLLLITLIAFFALAIPAHSQEVEKGWQTWAKVDPCVDHRSEWIIMAAKDPNPHGLSHYVPAQTMLFDPAGPICNKQHPFGCTYDEAKAEALNIQTSPKFLNYACKDWRIWKNRRNGQFGLVKGNGTLGTDWELVPHRPMSCEEAQAEAGLAGVCGGATVAHRVLRKISQPESRDANGKITVEASVIHVVACTGGRKNNQEFYIYEYVNRRGED